MTTEQPIIFCELSAETRKLIDDYAQALRVYAPKIGDHGLSDDEFWQAGLFQGAIERIRGTQSATTDVKRNFISAVLTYMQSNGAIDEWRFSGAGERHDYEVVIDDRTCIIEAKGCLDGNNTNIFKRPTNADEFIIWSLCQNPGADPRHNAWSGIHTRLSAEVIHTRQLVDAVIIWDMLCGTKGKACPKILTNPERATQMPENQVPPPCIYLFPRSIPDPRNNPTPKTHRISEVSFVERLYNTFKGDPADVVEVNIETKMQDNDTVRRTVYYREGKKIKESRWTKLKRAR